MAPGLPMDEGIPISMKTTTLVAIKRGLLLYWSLWFTIVFVTTLLGGLEALGAIDKGWKLAGAKASGVLLACLMVWEGSAVVVFWWAFRKFRGLANADGRALAAAFILAISLFAALLLAGLLFGGHLLMATHLKILVALLLSFLVVYFLPE